MKIINWIKKIFLRLRRKKIRVAAIDSSWFDKKRANFICDGVNDQEQIHIALDALDKKGGLVKLSKGKYDLTGSRNDQVSENVISMKNGDEGKW